MLQGLGSLFKLAFWWRTHWFEMLAGSSHSGQMSLEACASLQLIFLIMRKIVCSAAYLCVFFVAVKGKKSAVPHIILLGLKSV